MTRSLSGATLRPSGAATLLSDSQHSASAFATVGAAWRDGRSQDEYPVVVTRADHRRAQSEPMRGRGHVSTVRPQETAAACPAPVLPGYRVERTLAAGRLGPVVAATRLADDLAVAVHLLGRLDQPVLGRFLDQAEDLLALPAHPHLWPVLEVGRADDGTCFLVSERATGSIGDRLRAEGPLLAAVVLRAAVGGAAGLDALHADELLHGNITPANLLTGPAEAVALAPPLLPALADDGPGPTVGYRPPEVLGGADWTIASDVYALAATVFTLLSGRVPYADRAGDQDLVLRMLTGPAPDLAGCGVPAAVQDVVRRGMATDPRQRPATAGEFAALLARAYDQLETRPPTAPLPVVPTPAGGRALGSNYLLDSRIGRGATGQVWRGRRRDNGRPVAVKVLRSDLADEPETVARFLRERTTLTRVRHRNVARVHDLVAEGETLAIVMDLVDGEDLRGTMAAGGLAEAEAVALLAQVADGLAAVHDAGIVHRDVKPENVLVERRAAQPVARLTDFGIARAAGDSSLTRATRLMGTTAYLAPELAAGRPATSASDVYSFGVMAYELLAGRRPFDGDNDAALLRAHLELPPTRPADLSEPLWATVDSCLAKAPEARPTAHELVGALSAAALAPAQPTAQAGRTNGPTVAPGDSSRPRRGEPLATADATVPAPPRPAADAAAHGRPRRPWRLPAAVLAVAIVGAGSGIGLALQGRTPAPARAPATVPFLLPIPFVADSPSPGIVEVSFGGKGEPLGIKGYLVYVDGSDNGFEVERDQKSWRSGNLDGSVHCFSVAALVTTTGTPPPAAANSPQCLVADGH